MKGKKTGGRLKGTPNIATSVNKKVISELLADYKDKGLMQEDFYALDPKERIYLAERLMQYVVPKMQAVAFTGGDEDTKTIEDTLIELSKPKTEL